MFFFRSLLFLLTTLVGRLFILRAKITIFKHYGSQLFGTNIVFTKILA